MVATVTRIRTAAKTVRYFEEDGYYAKNDRRHREASQWHGAAAEALGLCGTVKPRPFERILQGYVPGTDIRLGRMRADEYQHRPGVDLTFSAPKSVSLEALVRHGHRKKSVIEAHDAAVRTTLDWIERTLLQTRRWDPEAEKMRRVPANGMVAATFRHVASRNLDPQLHTHAVVANMTRNDAGEWRSVEFTSLHRNQRRIGAFYRRELRQRLHKMGYGTVETMIGDVPGFEIEGYDRDVLMAFSTRRTEIEKYMEERGWDYSPARAQQATLYTRKRKEEPDPKELQRIWRERAAEVGLRRDSKVVVRRDDDPVREHATAHGKDAGAREQLADDADGANVEPSAEAHHALWRAVEHIEERQTVIREADLHACAHGFAPSWLSSDDLDGAIADLCRDGHLIEVETRKGDVGYVTDRAVKAEKEILAWMRRGRGQGRALAPKREDGYWWLGQSDERLTLGQHKAVTTLLHSNDRLVGVQGIAGSGKTAMLNEVVEAVGRNRVMCLAPSSGAARVLGRETGTRARTLQWLLTRYRDVGDGTADPRLMEEAHRLLGGRLLIVDEASMIGTVQMRVLMRIAEGAGVERLALIGDRRQLRSVEAGQPFSLLQKAGMETALMNEMIRQREPFLKDAVMHMIAGKPGRAIEELGSGVLDMEREDLAEAAADIWLRLDKRERGDTEILAPTHKLRAEINARIRDELAEEGRLHGRTLTIDRFVSHRLTRAQTGDIRNWRVGDMAVFHHDAFGLRTRAGDACRVTDVDKEGSQVLLNHPDGKVRPLDPSSVYRYRLDLYRTEPIELRGGDRICWTRNDRDRERGLINGERAWIEKITARRIHFLSDDQGFRRYSLRHDDPQLRHVDHAWSRTVHGSQGMTCGAVIAVLDSDLGPLTEQAMLYVQMTRARDNVVLLTDDRVALVDALETQTTEELSALVAIGLVDDPPEPNLVIPDLLLPWPQLVAWRAFAEKTKANGHESPFEADDCMEALKPILDLVEKSPDGLPGEFVVIAADYLQTEIKKTAAALKACVERRAALLDEYMPWRSDAEKALQARNAIMADKTRYGEHIPALAGWCGSIEEDGNRLEKALAFGEEVDRTLGDWRELNARSVDTILFHREGYAEVIDAIRKLVGEEAGMVPAEFHRALEDDEERARRIREEREREAAGPVIGEPPVEDTIPVAPPVEPPPVEVPVEAVTTGMSAAPGSGDDLQADTAPTVADPVAMPAPEPSVPAPAAQDDGRALAAIREYDMVIDALDRAIRETPEGTSWAYDNPKVEEIMQRVTKMRWLSGLDSERLDAIEEIVRVYREERTRAVVAWAEERYGPKAAKKEPDQEAESATSERAKDGERLLTIAEQREQWARKGAELEREEREKPPSFQPRRGGGISM